MRLVLSSQTRLWSVFAERTEWPRDTLSAAENHNDLQRHADDFQSRKAFAYTVLTPACDKCLGCVYIEPSKATAFDRGAYLWVRDDAVSLDDDLYRAVREWLTNCWPFKKTAFPGRDIPWQQWESYR